MLKKQKAKATSQVTCFIRQASFAFKAPSLGNLSQEPGGPRSPAVFGSIVSYIEQFFETVGISLADRQVHPSPFILNGGIVSVR